jgi:hypothetical protein
MICNKHGKIKVKPREKVQLGCYATIELEKEVQEDCKISMLYPFETKIRGTFSMFLSFAPFYKSNG